MNHQTLVFPLAEIFTLVQLGVSLQPGSLSLSVQPSCTAQTAIKLGDHMIITLFPNQCKHPPPCPPEIAHPIWNLRRGRKGLYLSWPCRSRKSCLGKTTPGLEWTTTGRRYSRYAVFSHQSESWDGERQHAGMASAAVSPKPSLSVSASCPQLHPTPCKQTVWVLCFACGRVEVDLSNAVGALGAGLKQRVTFNFLGQLCDANRLEASAATDKVSDSLFCCKSLCSPKSWWGARTAQGGQQQTGH